MADESTVESVLNGSNSDMGPTEFFVLMITKPKAAVPPKETSLSETTAATKIDSSIKSASTKTTTTTATTPSVKNFTETDSMLGICQRNNYFTFIVCIVNSCRNRIRGCCC